MKKILSFLISACLILSFPTASSAEEQRIDSFGNFMIESFENPKIQKINASIAAKSSKKEFVSQGNYSVRLEPFRAVGQPDGIGAGMKLDVGEADLSSYRTFAVDIFFAEDFESGSLTVAFYQNSADQKGFEYTVPCKFAKGKTRLAFRKTQVTAKNPSVSWRDIGAVAILWKNEADEDVKFSAHFDNFIAVSDEYEPIVDGKLSEFEYGDADRNRTVNVSDALGALQGAVGKTELDGEQRVLCDVDKSGNTEVTDALLILQYSVGKISCFEAEGRPIISEKSKYFGSTLTLEQGKKYAVDEYKQLLNFRTPNANYTNIQGGYFDGTKFVCALTKGSMRQNNEVGIIAEFDKEGNPIRYSKELNIEHGNNVTFVPKENAYLVSHCQPGWNVYSLIDADTLTEKSSGSLERDFFSMAYSPVLDMYASGFSAGQKVHTWNGDLTLAKEFDVTQPSSLSQGVFCDSEYIYFVRSHAGGDTFSEIRIYDWNGELKFQIDMPEWNTWSPEPEGINIIDGHIYVIARQNGITVYEITLKEV